jgi:DNA-directed RNA polymerase specialized sigma24 family protein
MAEMIAIDTSCLKAAKRIDPINGQDIYQDCLLKINEKEQLGQLSHVKNPTAYFITCLHRAFLDIKRKNVIFVELIDRQQEEQSNLINEIIEQMLTEPAPSKRAIYRQEVVSAYLHLGTAEKAAKHLNIHTQSVYNAVR